MKLQVTTIVGKTYEIDVNSTESVDSVKENLSSLMSVPREEQKLVFQGTTLLSSGYLRDYGLKEGDTVVLLKTRQPKPLPQIDLTPVPTKQIIAEHTSKGKPIKSTARKPTILSNLRTQLQEFVGSISSNNTVGTSSTSPSENTESEPVVLPTIDPLLLQQLKDMGFPEARATKALILNNMNPQIAMEWILEHEDDDDIDEPLTSEQVSKLAKSVTPDPTAVQKLKDMGFSEDDINVALKATNNNSEAACAWLLGEREEEGGFDDTNSNVLNSVLSNPTLQTALANPRVLQVLRSLMDDPSSAHQYINDPEVGPVLLQIHNIMMQGHF